MLIRLFWGRALLGCNTRIPLPKKYAVYARLGVIAFDSAFLHGYLSIWLQYQWGKSLDHDYLSSIKLFQAIWLAKLPLIASQFAGDAGPNVKITSSDFKSTFVPDSFIAIGLICGLIAMGNFSTAILSADDNCLLIMFIVEFRGKIIWAIVVLVGVFRLTAAGFIGSAWGKLDFSRVEALWTRWNFLSPSKSNHSLQFATGEWLAKVQGNKRAAENSLPHPIQILSTPFIIESMEMVGGFGVALS